jgi:hypothetical protein
MALPSPWRVAMDSRPSVIHPLTNSCTKISGSTPGRGKSQWAATTAGHFACFNSEIPSLTNRALVLGRE